MNGRPMNALEYYAQLARTMGPEQQVPPGNPVAEYMDGRAEYYGNEAADGLNKAIMHGGVGAMLGGVPGGVFGALALARGIGAISDKRTQGQMQDGASAWFNRFGSGDPNQGLPGTPSGPAYRRR